ncbi:hypothetical protein, partial [Caballeronia catudaia]|uniref:hypothetical protein n=1 Tax=Caballeronia catudaia TaxID=1777136 RepID=UPI001F26E0A4
MSQFLGALIKGTTKPMPLSVKTETANEARFESRHDVKHVLVEKIRTSPFLALLKMKWGVPRTRASIDRCLRSFTKDEGRPF